MALKAAMARGLRSAGMLGFADYVLGHAEAIRTHRVRRNFRLQHPDFVLPPPDLAYDAFGPWEPVKYRRQGQEHAQYIAGLIRRHCRDPRTICEWGCGPMRVLRHMRSQFPEAQLIGLDYNGRTIRWCKQHFSDIRFIENDLDPPLPLRTGEVDVIYGISVFTHLSEQRHHAYARDLMRCLAPGGLLIVTLHCDRYVEQLTTAERAQYDHGDLVVRDGVTEGKRTYVAYHNPAFVHRLFKGFRILEHDTADRIEMFRQDTWVMSPG